MKFALFILNLILCSSLMSQTGFNSAVYSFGVNDNNPLEFSMNPYRNSAILKSNQHAITLSKFQTFKNRKFFGYNLNLQGRLEVFESDLRYMDNQINVENEQFNKISLKCDWGLHWQFPIIKDKLYIIPSVNFGMTAYRKPNSVRYEMDNFANSENDFLYYIELQHANHLQLFASLNLSAVYMIESQIGIRAFARLNTTEKTQYYAFVLPASSSPIEDYDDFNEHKTNTNLLFNTTHTIELGLGIIVKLKANEK